MKNVKSVDLTPLIRKSLIPYEPEKVILFGSYAWGKPNESSDLDLLIIKNTHADYYKRIPEVRKYLYGIDKPFDILVLTEKEVRKRLAMGDFFIGEILEKGVVLYEKE